MMEKLREKLGDAYTLVIYKRPIQKNSKTIVAKAFGKETVFISEETFKKHGREIKSGAYKVFYGSKYENLAFRIALELEKMREEENEWVRCWECGRFVRKSSAVYEAGAGWYCGC